MVDCYKLVFNIMTSVLVLLGLAIAVLGYYGPSYYKQLDEKFHVKATEKYATMLKTAQFVLATIGLVIVGLAVLGLISFNCDFPFLLLIFRIALIVASIGLLALGGLAVGAVYLFRAAYKDYWEPKMEKFDPDPSKFENFFDLHLLQIVFQCCGVSTEDAYQKLKNLPGSCCLDRKDLPDDLSADSLGKILKNVTVPCTREMVMKLERGPCDKSVNENFIFIGTVIAYVSIIGALYLIALVVLTCCDRR